jgi:hypothetical protein
MINHTQEERVHKFFARRIRKEKGWDLGEIADPRRQSKSIEHTYGSILWSLELGLISNQPTLRDVEAMPLGSRGRKLVPTPVSDTTLDTEARRLDDGVLVEKLVQQVRDMHRSKMLNPAVLPFGVATIDGKNLATLDHDAAGTGHKRSKDNEKWQPKELRDSDAPYWLMPALRSTLTSAEARPCIYQKRLPPGTGESTSFCACVDELHQAYGKSGMFEVFDVDAGLTSLGNADHVNGLGYGYVMGLKGNQSDLFAEAQRLIEPMTKTQTPEAQTAWERRSGKQIRRSLWRTGEMTGYQTSSGTWTHLRQTWLIRQETKSHSGAIEIEDRYFITSLLWNRLTAIQIVALVRGHWGIENDAFNSLDLQWGEDDGPWCTQGTAIWGLGVLRIMAYNVVQLLRRRNLRHKKKTGSWLAPLSWRQVFKVIERALAFDCVISEIAVG